MARGNLQSREGDLPTILKQERLTHSMEEVVQVIQGQKYIFQQFKDSWNHQGQLSG